MAFLRLWPIIHLCFQVTQNFAGIVACRIFIGLPEVQKYFQVVVIRLNSLSTGGLLSGVDVPLVEMVHQEGFLTMPTVSFVPSLTYFHSQELALRSAILFVGLLISNAFGSVGPISAREGIQAVSVLSL